MKLGSTLPALATEIQRQANAKRDYIVDTSALNLVKREADFALAFQDSHERIHEYPVNRHAHVQIADRLGVPQRFWDRLAADVPHLLTVTANTLFSHKPERRMIRTLDNRARAFLSDRYHRIDHWDVLTAVMPVVNSLQGGAKVASCEVTDSKLYLKVVFPDVQSAILYTKPGGHERVREVIRAGFVLSNSEIGMGSYQLAPFSEVLTCTNGMIITEYAQRRAHLGRSLGGEDGENRELYTEETQRADDRALALKARDTVAAFSDQKQFQRIVDRMQAAADTEIKGDPIKAVEELASTHRLNEDEQAAIMRHLIAGADLSTWGLVQAVTRSAQDVPSYDRATELEALGGALLPSLN